MDAIQVVNLIIMIGAGLMFEHERRAAKQWRARAQMLEFIILNKAIEPPDPGGGDT